MASTYTVFGMYDEEGDQRSGMAFEDAFALMMERANCSFAWECVNGETRIIVRYRGSMPEAYECVRELQSPSFRSRNPNEAMARKEITRSLRTGVYNVWTCSVGATFRQQKRS